MRVCRSALVALPAAHVFDVIEAAEHYPQFLPWCRHAQIVDRDAAWVCAELTVQWGGMRFVMITRNPKQRPHRMGIQLVRGPFSRFDGEWRLTALTAQACKVAFELDCAFDSALLTHAAAPVFDRAADTLVDAFVQRAWTQPVRTASDSAPGATPAP